MSQVEIFKRNGKKFGYPQCCIDEFCLCLPFRSLSRERQAVSGQTGFVPCQRHAEAIIKGEITLKDLIKNRQYDKPFPISE